MTSIQLLGTENRVNSPMLLQVASFLLVPPYIANDEAIRQGFVDHA